MRIAIGLKAHSGWAALVVIGESKGEYHLVHRQRINLVTNIDDWLEKQPYHAAENLGEKEAELLIRRAIASVNKRAIREMRLAVNSYLPEQEILVIAVLTPTPMPNWTTAEILAVHPRMHKAEGVMYSTALANAALQCDLHLESVREKTINNDAAELFGKRFGLISNKLSALGKAAGPPWGKDQKLAALASVIALEKLT